MSRLKKSKNEVKESQIKASKFSTEYYNSRYKSYICKLSKEDSEALMKLLKRDDIGFTEFVIRSIYFWNNKKLIVEKRLE